MSHPQAAYRPVTTAPLELHRSALPSHSTAADRLRSDDDEPSDDDELNEDCDPLDDADLEIDDEPDPDDGDFWIEPDDGDDPWN